MLKKFLIGTFVVVAFAITANLASAAYDFGPTTLKVGSKGQYVMTLQTLVGATADGVFGPMTAAKVKIWQAANGLTADGVFGPMSKAKANATAGTCPVGQFDPTTGQPCGGSTGTLPLGCTSTVGYSPTTGAKCDGSGSTPTGPLTGTDGTIAEVNQISQYSSEEVGSGMDDVKVMGFDVKASKDGDIALKSIKLTFDATGNDTGDSDRLIDYIDSVSIYMNSTKIATVDTDDFTKDATGIYSKVMTFDSSAVVRADKTEKFYVSVDAVSNLDSGDINSDSWTVGVNNIRYVDGSGVVTTDADIAPAAIEYNSAGDGVAISFVTFSSAADTELKLSLASSSPLAGVSTVSTTANTDKVELLKGKMVLEGESDVLVDEVRFIFTTDATNVDDVAPTVYLTIDGEEFSESMTATAGTTEVINFDNLDLTVSAGDTVDFTVSADINDIEAGTFDEGKYLKAELDETRRALMVTENEEGDALTDGSEVTGTAMGNGQYFYSIAPKIEVVSASITPNDNGSSASASATAKMKLKITADGGTVYLNGDDETTAANEFITLAVDGGNASSSVSSYTYTTTGTYTVTNSGADNEYFTLYDGDTMYVEIEALVAEAAGSAPVLVGMKGTAVLFGTVVTSDTTRSAHSMSWSTLTDLLKTGKTTLDS